VANVRRFFRYDVEIPIYIETVNAFHNELAQLRESVFPQSEVARLEAIDEELNQKLDAVFQRKPEAIHVFLSLNKRLDFIHWLLDHLVELQDPRKESDYKYRLKMDQRHQPPTSKKETKLLPLMQNFYYQIDEIVHELLSVVEKSYEGKIFTYIPTPRPTFEHTKYVHNLEELADNGTLPAQILVLLIEKYNLLVGVLNRLKERYRKISDSQLWPVRKVNLSAGGVSFISETPYERFARFHVFMQLDETLLICEGRMVVMRPAEEGRYLVGLEFEFLPFEKQQAITRFIQYHELKEAQAEFPSL
jgi:hypothetical protein